MSEFHFGRPRTDLEAPRLDRPAGAFREPVVPREDVLEALLLEHGEGLTQAVQHRERRGIREVARGVRLSHVAEVEEDARQLGLLVQRERLLARAHDAESRRQHESLLGACHREIDAPLVHPEIDAGDRAHAVDHQERRMPGIVQRLAHGAHIAGDAGRGLVVREEHRLDLVLLVGGERFLVALDRGAFSPFGVEHVHREPEALRHVDPELAEHAEPRGKDAVTRRKRVGERSLPRTGPARRER